MLSALAGDDLDEWGLITLDAHHDLRDGHSNGSPVRELLDEGLDGRHVVQIGIADFSNSAAYANDAVREGITVYPRDVLRTRPMDDVVDEALTIAGAGGRPVYVDIDLDVVDRAGSPGAPPRRRAASHPTRSASRKRRLRSRSAHAGLDVTEVDVDRDDDERTVRLAALTVLEALAGLARRAP